MVPAVSWSVPALRLTITLHSVRSSSDGQAPLPATHHHPKRSYSIYHLTRGFYMPHVHFQMLCSCVAAKYVF